MRINNERGPQVKSGEDVFDNEDNENSDSGSSNKINRNHETNTETVTLWDTVKRRVKNHWQGEVCPVRQHCQKS